MRKTLAALALAAACTSALANGWDGFTISGLWAKLWGCTAYCGGNRVN